MHKYKFKISAIEWLLHISVLLIAVFYAVLIAFMNSTQKPSAWQTIIHITTIVLALLNLFILYKRKNTFLELDNYSVRYIDFNKSKIINLIEVTEITRSRSGSKELVFYTGTGRTTIPLVIHNQVDFLKNLCSVIDSINYKIKYDRNDILNNK